MSDDTKTMDEAGDGLTRLGFMRVALGGAALFYGAALGYPVYRYLASPVEKAAQESAVSQVTLKAAKKLPAGTALMFKFGAKPSLLIHHADGTWSALSAICTHLGCTVQYQDDKKQIFCACHGGVYDPKTGTNTSGPPPKGLERYEVKFTNDDATVSRA